MNKSEALSQALARLPGPVKTEIADMLLSALTGHPPEPATKAAKRWWKKWMVVEAG